jgi:hypothetical protein
MSNVLNTCMSYYDWRGNKKKTWKDNEKRDKKQAILLMDNSLVP